MAEYHGGQWVTASFVDRVLEQGLSRALAERDKTRELELRVPILTGIALHYKAQGVCPWVAHGGTIGVFHGKRGSGKWREVISMVREINRVGCPVEGILLEAEALEVDRAFSSLTSGEDTKAKREARGLLSARQQVAEASCIWEPVEGLTAAVRPDLVVVVRGQVVAVPIKTTALPITLPAWWRQWSSGAKYHGWLTSACFHHYGLRAAYGRTIPQMWMTIRTEPPYPWSMVRVSDHPDDGAQHLYRGRSALETMDHHWETVVLPTLREIRDAGLEGRRHGLEECGILAERIE
jgi:hypothetical protein